MRRHRLGFESAQATYLSGSRQHLVPPTIVPTPMARSAEMQWKKLLLYCLVVSLDRQTDRQTDRPHSSTFCCCIRRMTRERGLEQSSLSFPTRSFGKKQTSHLWKTPRCRSAVDNGKDLGAVVMIRKNFPIAFWDIRRCHQRVQECRTTLVILYLD
jgi:hypothetical protein